MFGDVLLRDQQAPRDVAPAKPGQGGWPTIRYYNKKTGKDGADYIKKTKSSMCDELGPRGGLLPDYIREAGGISDKCDVKSGSDCSEKEQDFIKDKSDKENSYFEEQVARISKNLEGNMSDKNKDWAEKQLNIYKQLLEAAKNAAKEEL